ncbi:MAG: hypothetical protein ABL929_09305 [Ferruginibacter sp.]|nr:hypothetical protein [Ferruginibacter sp.]
MDILILVFLVIKIGKLALQKGLNTKKWKWNLILAWIAGELIGMLIGVAFFGKENIFSCVLLAWGFALTAYFMLLNYLNKLPDV